MQEVKAINNATIAIEGMSCSSCSGTIERLLQSTSGILEASVVLAMETGHVKYDAGQLTIEDIVDAIEAVGFGAQVTLLEKDILAEKSINETTSTAGGNIVVEEKEKKVNENIT